MLGELLAHGIADPAGNTSACCRNNADNRTNDRATDRGGDERFSLAPRGKRATVLEIFLILNDRTFFSVVHIPRQ